MDDRVRTAAFIRGSVRAVEHTLESRSHRPLHLYEAGCGPLGTLIVPLLARFGPDELGVSVVDLHPESIDSFRQVLDHLGLLPRLREAICGDATRVHLESAADLVLSETMFMALFNEPQVAIAQALMRQHPEAILLPHSVRVELSLIDWAAESGSFPMEVRDRVVLGTVFELTATTARDLVEKDGLLPAGRVRIPEVIPPGLSLFLTTTIEVFDNVRLSDYDTEITIPVAFYQPGHDAVHPGDTLQFAYRVGNPPGLVWQLADGTGRG